MPPVYFGVSAALMLALHRFLPLTPFVPRPVRYLGIVLIVAGLAAVLGAALAFRRAGTTIKPFEESSALLTTGLYARTRNPIYLGMLTALFGLGVWLGSHAVILVPPAFFWFIERRFILAEEAMLEEKFGEEYAAYRARVPRWF